MSELNEKVEEPREQPSEPRPLREVSPEELKNILEAHLKWKESEMKEGKRADLVRANLANANLQEAALAEANLEGADLRFANLQEADLRGVNLQKADLDEAHLQGANLIVANLQRAKLLEAKLQGADLRKAKLQGADLRKARHLTAPQVKKATNWKLAFYSDDFLKELGLPPDHNKTLPDKLAEMEKEKKATGGK